MSDWPDDKDEALEQVVNTAERATDEGGVTQMRAENAAVGDACEFVAEFSERGELSSAESNALADMLGDTLARYNKTDLKQEFREVFVEESQRGTPFNVLLENRLESVTVVKTTDRRQGQVFRWHFSDGVMLETEQSKDGTRKHNDWRGFKQDYFDALLATGNGERIAEPEKEMNDPEDWVEWISGLLLDHAEEQVHVGPRTEAVRQLRDLVERSAAYLDMEHMRDRQGVWIDADADDVEDGELVTDGGVSELRVSQQAIKRVCDEASISTRALQVELDARGLTAGGSGVSDAEYIDGRRVPFWSLDPSFADPQEVVPEVQSPAEQVIEEERERAVDERTAVGAVEDDDSEDDAPAVRDRREHEEPDGDQSTGEIDSYGVDPDGGGDDDE